MRVAIVGAGAVGCYLAARLAAGGTEVVLVGRPAQVAAIERDGLAVREPAGNTTRHRLRAVESLHERPDLVLLTVKTQDVAAACREMLPYAAGVPIVAMQNGVQGDRLAAEVLGRDAVVGAVVMCAVSYLQPGTIAVQFPGWLIAGEPFRVPEARTREIVNLLNTAMPTYLTTRLGAVRWSKLISNLNNGLCAATGLTLPEMVATPAGRVLSIRVMREGYRVVRAAGYHLDHGLYGLSPGALRRDPTAALIAVLQATMAPLLATLPEPLATALLVQAGRSRLNRLPVRFSTWQSLARGRPSEIDYLNGEIVRLGKRLGIPTPYNGRLVRLIHRVEQTGAFYPVEQVGAFYRAGDLPAGEGVADVEPLAGGVR